MAFAHSDEISAIIDMCGRTLAEHHERSPDIFTSPAMLKHVEKQITESFRHYRFLPRRTSNSIIVARNDGDLCGYVNVKVQQHKATIVDIYTSPGFRKQGLARQLVVKATEFGSNQGAIEIQAIVWKGNISSEKLFEASYFEQELKIFKAKTGASIKKPKMIFAKLHNWVVFSFLVFVIVAAYF